MSKSTKEGKMNFFYLEDEKIKKKKGKKRAEHKKSAPKKEKEKDKEETVEKNFNFDNEIIIGVTKLPEEKKQKKSEKQEKKKPNKKEKVSKEKKQKQQKKKIPEKKASKQDIQRQQKQKEKIKKILKVTKWCTLLCLLIGATIYILLSPIFNIKEIVVRGNEQITTEQIISLSKIEVGINAFKIRKSSTKKAIKENAYIDNVKIRRILPDTLQIEIEERKPSFQLELGNSYVYMNNQGYLIDMTEQKLELPIITGIKTNAEDIKVGNRLNTEDLEKMTSVLQIIDVATSNEIANQITRIDIADKQEYKLFFEKEGKIAHIGDASNLSTRMIYLKAILEKEKEKAGEIFVNMDLNTEYPVFREKV